MDNDNVLGAVTGVIKPPPDLRELVDTTAQYVAQNGKSFEDKIKAGGKSKFDFLNVGNPYHQYYLSKVDDFALKQHRELKKQESGEEDDQVDKGEKPEQETATEAQKEESSVENKEQDNCNVQVIARESQPTAVAQAVKKKRDQPPPELMYTLDHPLDTEKPYDIELMKLTARHAAVLGRTFVTSIAAREQYNPEFSFLQPQNQLFQYFTSLVNAYMKILDWKESVTSLEENFKDKLSILDRAVHRVEWKWEEERKKKEEEQKTNEDYVAFNEIDWHDFVLVETIDFKDAVPAAATVDDASKEAVKPSAIKPGDEEEEEDSDVDMDMDDDDDELDIRRDYKPQVSTGTSAATTVTLPSGEKVAADSLNEHMRVELIDPKWKEQREKFLERKKVVPFVEQDISKNLARLASNRPDVFRTAAETEAPKTKKQKQ
uniref:SURP motif domain-containing protein n=1 Tax=Mucochytrium quahogii TaxID=96639 RepID=A0A7S2SJ64_9STRA|mmetsp:Transcript_25772/g.41657  ORF Transcript_25772/g.41657 Transcript_25772/m.41657 type:complete len:432 (+) Transcript_25772:167-1462(+)|eukprot:CAMPEP_0203758636 /NCGR_PEP_ID=MMETSP0098-20131031/11495_1 /ASSEMBLY_ACC=CAM_ASM_000208 /TAXON_ID=96639 /ORGANISM=" , Strain NY0313808BC1" /LENGTH=431 /DNA_ID=CAMNT_0050651177 /DNA_START=139 /DNA_END=1434 /DNA_ORIENTATION=-